MRKIGATSTGSVIIEMTAAQYAALTQVMDNKREAEQELESEQQRNPVERPVMALKRKQVYVRSCFDKLRPETRHEAIRSIRAMFQGSGGIRQSEIEQMIESLLKDKYFSIDEQGRIRYRDKDTVISILEEESRREKESKAESQQSAVDAIDKDALEEALSPSLLVEVAKCDQPVDRDSQI
jgi:hypothetical protein